MSAHSPTSSCVTSSTTSQSREQPHPAVRRLRAQPEVLHGAVSLGDQHDPLAELRELRHDPLRQVRLPGARHAGEEQALPLQAVGHGILHVDPGVLLRRRLGLQSRLAVLSLQALHFLQPNTSACSPGAGAWRAPPRPSEISGAGSGRRGSRS